MDTNRFIDIDIWRLTDKRRGTGWLELMLALSVVILIGQLAWPSLDSWYTRPRAGVQFAGRFENGDYLL